MSIAITIAISKLIFFSYLTERIWIVIKVHFGKIPWRLEEFRMATTGSLTWAPFSGLKFHGKYSFLFSQWAPLSHKIKSL